MTSLHISTARLAFVLGIIGAGCSYGTHDHSPLTTSSLRAVCASQEYLRANGYLDHRPQDPSQIELELWDRIRYEADGKLDWSSLLNDRYRTYSEKLYGVTRSGEDFIVLYRFGSDFSCVRVSPNLDVHLHEAQCKPSLRGVRRIDEHELACS